MILSKPWDREITGDSVDTVDLAESNITSDFHNLISAESTHSCMFQPSCCPYPFPYDYLPQYTKHES